MKLLIKLLGSVPRHGCARTWRPAPTSRSPSTDPSLGCKPSWHEGPTSRKQLHRVRSAGREPQCEHHPAAKGTTGKPPCQRVLQRKKARPNIDAEKRFPAPPQQRPAARQGVGTPPAALLCAQRESHVPTSAASERALTCLKNAVCVPAAKTFQSPVLRTGRAPRTET